MLQTPKLMTFLPVENLYVFFRRYVFVVNVDKCCVEYDVCWRGLEVVCDGVGVWGAMCGVCVYICDIAVCCVVLSICVDDMYSVCLSVFLLLFLFIVFVFCIFIIFIFTVTVCVYFYRQSFKLLFN